MKIQKYRARYAAERYAREIVRKFPSVTAAVVPTVEFLYAVCVTTKEGRTGLAGKRPNGYGRDYPADIMGGNFRIPGFN